MRQTLRAAVNADGGWGYYPASWSRLEPTCWTILALLGDPATSDRRPLLESAFLMRHRRVDGMVIDPAEAAEDRPNFAFNALAALLLAESGTTTAARTIVDTLIQHKGIKLPASNINRQDNALQGWGWIDATFSWVEPTAWCLLALKKVARESASARTRIDEAERLLADRCCDAGGWNYGNANMLGKNLHAYVPTTALGLLAMQDRTSHACVARSLEYLVHHRLDERSAMALALTSISLRVFGCATGDVDDLLQEQWDRTGFLGNSHLTAMAYYALTADAHGAEVFRV